MVMSAMDKADILFVPLNTNHVGIFRCVAAHLKSDYVFLCHDRISESRHFHTECTLKNAALPYVHFPEEMDLKKGTMAGRIKKYLTMRKVIRDFLGAVSPRFVILAMDNDPIAKAFIDEARRAGCRSFMIQEGLVRPGEYSLRKVYWSDYVHKLLNACGVFLKYIKYGTGGCDRYLLFGQRAERIFNKRGVPSGKIELIGQPKYDEFLHVVQQRSGSRVRQSVLFAAPTDIVASSEVIAFTRMFADAAAALEVPMTIKMHPRSAASVQQVESLFEDRSGIEVIKEGDDTFDLLGKTTILLTISSTVVLEALLMDRECITVDYLAGEFRLGYGEYDAVHTVESKQEISKALEEAMKRPKSRVNKTKLLHDELYELDGNAGQRAAAIIQSEL